MFPRDSSPSSQQRGAFKGGSSRISQKNLTQWAAATTPMYPSPLLAGENEVATPGKAKPGKGWGMGRKQPGSCYQENKVSKAHGCQCLQQQQG